MKARKTLRIPNTWEALTAAVQELDDYFDTHDVPPKTRFTAHLVLEEIGSNIIKYSRNHEMADFFKLSMALDPFDLIMSFQDQGEPFDATKGPKVDMNATIEDSTIGGRGLLLVKNLSSSMRYERVGDVNVLEVRLKLVE